MVSELAAAMAAVVAGNARWCRARRISTPALGAEQAVSRDNRAAAVRAVGRPDLPGIQRPRKRCREPNRARSRCTAITSAWSSASSNSEGSTAANTSIASWSTSSAPIAALVPLIPQDAIRHRHPLRLANRCSVCPIKFVFHHRPTGPEARGPRPGHGRVVSNCGTMRM